MLFFHLVYDLNLFGYIKIPSGNIFWDLLPNIIVTLFMVTVGMSLRLAHKGGIRKKPFALRLGKIILCAFGVSLVSYFLFPNKWIYFGTLHSIACCSIFSLPFICRPRLALAMGLCLLSLPLFNLSIPWFTLPIPSMDYIPPFPWLGHMLIGIFLVHVNLHRFRPPFRLALLAVLGRHSLGIYLIHQPIFYGIIYFCYNIVGFGMP